MARTRPNIIITGTPGVGNRSAISPASSAFLTRAVVLPAGKSSHCELLAEATQLRHISINQFAKDKGCLEGYDNEFKSWVVDEDRLLSEIEPDLERGGSIIDWHVCEIFPERLIDLVVVLRVDSTILYDRLKSR